MRALVSRVSGLPARGIQHVDLAVGDVERSLAFYDSVLGPLGLKEKFRNLTHFKVLLLGAGESGKTTVIKQLKSKKGARSAKALRFKGKKASLTLQPGKAKTVKVKFTKKTLKAITKALRARKKLVATVVVTSKDSASKVTRKTLKITIRR